MSNSEEILAANTKLREEIKSFRDSVEKFEEGLAGVDNRQKHTRWGLYFVTFLLAVAVLVAGWLKLDGVDDKATENRNRLNFVQQTQLATCQTTNVTRAEAKKIWYDFLDLATRPDPEDPKTPAELARQKRFLSKFTVRIDKTYGQRDCSDLKDEPELEDPSATPSPQG